MEAIIKQLNGKWTVNGKTYNELTDQEKEDINAFFVDWKLSTNQRCRNFCTKKAKELCVNDAIVFPTKVFDEAFDNPIEQLNNLTP